MKQRLLQTMEQRLLQGMEQRLAGLIPAPVVPVAPVAPVVPATLTKSPQEWIKQNKIPKFDSTSTKDAED